MFGARPGRGLERLRESLRCSFVTVNEPTRIAAYLQDELDRLALDGVDSIEAARWSMRPACYGTRRRGRACR